jgi:cysteine-rich repeat protein
LVKSQRDVLYHSLSFFIILHHQETPALHPKTSFKWVPAMSALLLLLPCATSAVAAPAMIPYSESFESDLGVWDQSTSDDFDWIRRSTSTPSSNTGPSAAQDGSIYLYTEASSPNFPNLAAAVEASFNLQTASYPSMKFYYHMYGATMGTLTVRVYDGQWHDVWSRTGEQGFVWMEAVVDLTPFVGNDVLIQLEGTTGTSYSSDMAVDHITITEVTRYLEYSVQTFGESAANDGTIANPITLTLYGDTFTPDVVSGQHFVVTGVPTGLSATLIRMDDTTMVATLEGSALDHTFADSVDDLQISFEAGAFGGSNPMEVMGNGRPLRVGYLPYDCGDGALNIGEACDDGNTTDGDGCDATCDPEPGYECTGDPTTCISICGDGTLASDEVCDDSNTTSGDGCSADCLSDETCGNGIVDLAAGEVCDDGANYNGDGCSADCLSDETCGNGIVDTFAGEQCDDGETVPGDGCTADCELELCGDGNLSPDEVCDDGNTIGSDGCSSDCQSDEACGNGVVDLAAGEHCDDGNTTDGDGCGADCTLEPSYQCTGQPSICEDMGGGAQDDGGCTSAGHAGGPLWFLACLLGWLLLRRRRLLRRHR